MKKVAGLGCLGFLGLTACYVLALVVMPAYAVAETAFQLPMFAPQIEAWALGSDPGQESEAGASIRFSLRGYAGPASFACILPPEVGALSSPFGDTEGRTSPHQGIDYSTCWCQDYPVRTHFGGMVTYAGDHAVYGGTVVIENQGWQVFFAHLDAELASPGEVVAAGDVIGLSGNTGRYTTGPHVHVEVRECDVESGSCVPRDPMVTLLPGQSSYCNWESLGMSVSCSDYRADPGNTCPGIP
jgi:murein DD-endopeptidase MepM/ murein hydrolase activator NlpD